MAIGDYKYPICLDLEGDPGILGSMDYQPSSGNRKYKIGEVISIENPQLDFTVNHNEASAKNFDILKFPNGVKLRLKLWVAYDTISGQAYQSVKGTVKFVKTDASEYSGQSWNIGGANNYSSGGNSYVQTCPVSVVNAFGIKIIFVNDYTSSGVDVAGVTPLSGVFLYAYIPVESNQTPGTFRTFVNLVRGADLKISFDGSSVPDDPSYLFYPSIEPGSSLNSVGGEYVLFYYSNINELLAKINEGGPDLSIDDLISSRDPYDPTQETDPSKPGGGDGNYDKTSDPIDFPALPTGGALSSGSITAFVVSSAIMTAVFTELWNTNVLDLSTFQKLLEAPLDSLIELECLPVVPPTSGQGHIMLGNFDTNQTAPLVSNQYMTVDCGSKKVNRFWGSAMDYAPYTKCEIYLPFCGIHQLNIDDVMNTTIHVKYNIDLLTGNLVANVKCGQSVLYKFTGNCKATVPVTSKVRDAITPLIHGTLGMALASNPTGLAIAGVSAAVNVAMSKTKVQRSGEISGITGILDDFVPYLIIHRPQQSLAKDFKKEKGYPCNMSAVLNSLTGYTEVEYVHLTGISGATDTELQEIENLLKEGVII